jgi:hypothetical protein
MLCGEYGKQEELAKNIEETTENHQETEWGSYPQRDSVTHQLRRRKAALSPYAGEE